MDIVKYDNEFNLTKNFNKLSQVEQDIFFTITSEFTKNKKTHLTLTANFIRQKINMKGKYRPSEVTTFLKDLSLKLSEIPFIIESDNDIIVTPIFAKFHVDKTTQETEIILNDQFLSYFYDIPISFTQFELSKFVNLNSKYAKTLFRYLLDLKHYAHERKDGVRIWTIDFEEFKKIMVFPKSYQTTSIMRTLNKSVEEINKSGYITNLTYDKEFWVEKKGKPVKSLIFSYQIAKRESLVIPKEQPQPQPQEAPFPQDTETAKSAKPQKLFCPYCHKEVVKKNGKNGSFYGHKYYKQTTCKHSWTSLEDLMTETNMVQQANKDREAQKQKNAENMEYLEKQRDQLFHNMGLMEESEEYNKKGEADE